MEMHLLRWNWDCANEEKISWRLEIIDAENHITADFSGDEEEKAGKHSISKAFFVENPRLWSDREPYIYCYRWTVRCGEQESEIEGKLAFRTFCAKENQLMLNGKPEYLRGILHWGYYDDIMIPNPGKERSIWEMLEIRKYGFNAVKHCLYIPREETLCAADELGMLLWIELPLWLPEPNPELEARIRYEYPRILRQLQGHPSVCIVSLGCELNDSVPAELLEEMYHLAKETTGTLVRDNSGSGECYGGLVIDFADFYDYHFYADLQNFTPLVETFTPAWRNRRPWIFGEFCDIDTLRDLDEIRKEKGVEKLHWELNDTHKNPISTLKPDFILGKHDERMEKNGIRSRFERLKKLSVEHSMLHRKVTLEQTRAFPEVSGYVITSIRDVPIATSGFFDDLLRPKFDAEAFLQTNADRVLVPAWDLTRVWINGDRVRNRERYNFFGGDTYGLHLLLSDYDDPLRIERVVWHLTADGACLKSGEISLDMQVDSGEVAEAAYVSFELPEADAPLNALFEAEVIWKDGACTNQWPVFIYPRPEKLTGCFYLYDPQNLFQTLESVVDYRILHAGEAVPSDACVVIASQYSGEIREYMRQGGRVFLMQREAGVLPSKQVSFWRESMIEANPHPLTDALPRSGWMEDLRYFGVSTTTAFDEECMYGIETRPILRRIDTRNWSVLHYLMEFSEGKGRGIATTLRLEGGMGKEPLFIGGNPFSAWLISECMRELIGK